MQLKVNENKINLKNFLSEKLKISKSKAKNLIDTRNIFVNNKRAWIASFVLNKGDSVYLPDTLLNDFKNKKTHNIKIIYEDDFVLALDKPAGIISDKTHDSLENLLRKNLSNHNIHAIHRLDKNTSGILLFAKNNEIFEKYKKLWQEKKVKKTYIAICHNIPDFIEKKIKISVDNKEAESFVKRISAADGLSLLKITTFTGRKHQIRIHLAKTGFPIVGDNIYGPNIIKEKKLLNIKRQLLHAFELSYICPFTEKNIKIKAQLPDDFLLFKNLIKKENIHE